MNFIESHLEKDRPILDIGAYASEILCILHRLEHTNLTGLDLNGDIARMPYAGSIRYEIGNFLSAPFPDESFDAITAISVIEHGYDGPALFKEISRLLRPSGYFIASFDYWPEKIDTSGTKFFGMDWRIFSSEEVDEAVEEARQHGLALVGEPNPRVGDRPIKTVGHDYTFGWTAFRKTA